MEDLNVIDMVFLPGQETSTIAILIKVIDFFVDFLNTLVESIFSKMNSRFVSV
jgi:hypothetical protein